MDLPDDVLAMIDGYVSTALDATGTRRAARGTGAPYGGGIILELHEPDPEPPTQSRASDAFEVEEGTAWQVPAWVIADDDDEITAVYALSAG